VAGLIDPILFSAPLSKVLPKDLSEASPIEPPRADNWFGCSGGFGFGDHVCDELLRVLDVNAVVEAHRDAGHITP
jgi:hypothetical protein